MNMMYVWIVLTAALLVIEAMTMGLTTIWFAGGCVCALIICLIGLPVWAQVGVFAGVSILLLMLTRPLAQKFIESGRTRTNADSLIGQEAVITEKVDNLKGTGRARVNGQDWTARSVITEQTIEQGEVVMIRAIEGVKLIVGKRKGLSGEQPE